MAKLTNEVEGLSLETLPHELREQFAAVVERIAEAFNDESDLLAPNERKAEITIKLALTMDLETRHVALQTGLSAKFPAYRTNGVPVFLSPGSTAILVDTARGRQSDLFREPPPLRSVVPTVGGEE